LPNEPAEVWETFEAKLKEHPGKPSPTPAGLRLKWSIPLRYYSETGHCLHYAVASIMHKYGDVTGAGEIADMSAPRTIEPNWYNKFGGVADTINNLKKTDRTWWLCKEEEKNKKNEFSWLLKKRKGLWLVRACGSDHVVCVDANTGVIFDPAFRRTLPLNHSALVKSFTVTRLPGYVPHCVCVCDCVCVLNTLCPVCCFRMLLCVRQLRFVKNKSKKRRRVEVERCDTGTCKKMKV
jgi:hypothetical protein